jgi:hypothetical protein
MERDLYQFQTRKEKPLAYNPFLDREEYLKANRTELPRLNDYTKQQLETHIGERFNVLLSVVRYEIKNGHLYGQNCEEPAIEMFKKGVGRNGSSSQDLPRENAEVLGFSQIDYDFAAFTVDPKVKKPKNGEQRLSISPPGGSYRHNFYDDFTFIEDESGHYVEMRRYSSGLRIEETVAKLREEGLVDVNFQAKAEYSLSHPIKIEADDVKFETADDIHSFLHIGHEFATREELEQVIRICAPLITSYINTLVNNPLDLEMQLSNYNALLWQADLVYDAIKVNDRRFVIDLALRASFHRPTEEEILIMGANPIRQAMIGCGFSGGFKVGGSGVMKAPFSVVDNDDWDNKLSRKYNKPGPCRNCGEDVLVGPCKVCRSCNDQIEMTELASQAA